MSTPSIVPGQTVDTKAALQLAYNLGHSSPTISTTIAQELRNALFPLQELLDECSENKGRPSVDVRVEAMHAIKRIERFCRALESGVFHDEAGNDNNVSPTGLHGPGSVSTKP